MKHMSKTKLILGIIVVLLAWFFFYEPQYDGPVTQHDERGVLLFAHRGFGKFFPDNALRSGLTAYENGFHGIDVDGQLSQDGVPVIFHDLSVGRLTSGSGRVSELSSETLLSLDLGTKFSTSTTDYFVETFETFVMETKGKGILMVELKVPGAGSTGFEDTVVEIIKRHDRLDDVYLSSFNPLVLWRLKRIDERVHTALIFMDTNWNPSLLAEIPEEDRVDLPWALRQEWIRRGIRKIIKPDLLSVNHEVDPGTIDTLMEKGWPIFLWTPNTEPEMRKALERKPYGLISDEVYLMKELVQ